MDERTRAVYALLKNAQCLVKSASEGQQVILAETATSQVRGFVNRDVAKAEDEEAFLSVLREQGETELRRLVCMWYDGALDVPSIRFRRSLLALCPKNKDAQLILQGENIYVLRTVAATMPPMNFQK